MRCVKNRRLLLGLSLGLAVVLLLSQCPVTVCGSELQDELLSELVENADHDDWNVASLTAAEEYSDSYMSGLYYERLQAVERTGNYRADMLAIAASQVGYCAGQKSGDLSGAEPESGEPGRFSEYGRYIAKEEAAWCSEFASWCVRQAGVPTDILKSAAAASPSQFGAPCYLWEDTVYGSGKYTPRPGDLVLYIWSSTGTTPESKYMDHTGIVSAPVEETENGLILHTIEGNVSSRVKIRNRTVNRDGSLPSGNGYVAYFVSPDYEKTELALYQRLKNGYENMVAWDTAEFIDVSDLNLSWSTDRTMIENVHLWVINDHPEFYYVRNGNGNFFSSSQYRQESNGKLTGLRPRYYDHVKEPDALELFDRAVETALLQVEGVTDPVETAVILHDYLASQNVYSNKHLAAWTSYGPLVRGASVCRGYAAAYTLLMRKCGIPCVTVGSYKMGDSGHNWNMVQLDGKWYHVDVNAANNQGCTRYGFCSRNRFLLSDTTIAEKYNYHDWYVRGIMYREDTPELFDKAFACTDTKYETGTLFGNPNGLTKYAVSQAMHKGPDGRMYYMQTINSKTRLICATSSFFEIGETITQIYPYQKFHNDGKVFHIHTGLTWAGDDLYYVSQDLKLMRYRLTDGSQTDLGQVPFLSIGSLGGSPITEEEDEMGILYRPEENTISVISRSQQLPIAMWDIRKETFYTVCATILTEDTSNSAYTMANKVSSQVQITDFAGYLPKDCMIFAASYEENGKMLQLHSGTLTKSDLSVTTTGVTGTETGILGTVTFEGKVQTGWRIFFVDSKTMQPLCPATVIASGKPL